jgi:hypothetical protein
MSRGLRRFGTLWLSTALFAPAHAHAFLLEELHALGPRGAYVSFCLPGTLFAQRRLHRSATPSE